MPYYQYITYETHGISTENPRNFRGKLTELFSQHPQPFLIRFNLALFF